MDGPEKHFENNEDERTSSEMGCGSVERGEAWVLPRREHMKQCDHEEAWGKLGGGVEYFRCEEENSGKELLQNS